MAFITKIKDFKKEIAAFLIMLAAYFPTLIWMWDRWWSKDSYYTHGILVPIVSGFLVWQLKDDLAKIKRKESAWAIRLIVIGLGVHLFSSLFRVYFSSGFSMILVLMGLILFFFGGEFLKRIIFPVLFLLFMIPIPLVAIATISFKLKILAAEIATVVLNNMRIPALREGSVIRMRDAYVIVDDVCSGLRSLIALTALGSVFAYWMKDKAYKRILLFLSTIPIAIITNVCRVILLCCISEIWGPKYATGFIHDLSGFMVFALAFILLFVVGKLIE
ncbi:MAG: exosortase [Candidatus Omnitrophica bacterium]|nr:exosortase [Candidatus Omnitrophota bacterium]MCB9746963.1 exosortase [Candidatus Omnitrophota bacterium]